LKEGKVLVVCDFAENYSFVVQDEIQSFHWNSEMATVHPLVAYYKTGAIIHHVNFAVQFPRCSSQILNPDFNHPRSPIPDPGSKNSNKREE
jgi:hypothetical protein